MINGGVYDNMPFCDIEMVLGICIAEMRFGKGIEIYNKMMPFFTIALDNGFWSSHYGTELTRA